MINLPVKLSELSQENLEKLQILLSYQNDAPTSTLPIANPITTQTITEPNLVVGMIVGSAIALFSLKRN